MLPNKSSKKVINTEKLSLIENRKRILIVFKFLAFLVLFFVNKNYPEQAVRYGIQLLYIRVLLFYVSANLIISVLRIILVYFYLKRNHLKDDYKDNFILGVNRIASLLSVAALFIAFLNLFDITPGELFTSISIVAAALALLFKDYISNLINGMILMFSDQFALNDIIKIGEYKGRIIDITLLNVILKTEEGEIIYIPNNMVFSRDVVNYSKTYPGFFILDFEVPIQYAGKVTLLEEHLSGQLAVKFENLFGKDQISVKIDKIRHLDILVRLMIYSPQQLFKHERAIKKTASVAILEFLDKEKQFVHQNF
jgi:small-conductance mechanosensitive channel